MNLILNYSGCPQNFVLHDNQCYGFFVNKTQKLKYSDAKDRCQHTLGYNLATVFSREETNFLGNMTVQTNNEIGKSSFNFPWIGLHKNAYSPEGITTLKTKIIQKDFIVNYQRVHIEIKINLNFRCLDLGRWITSFIHKLER